MPTKSKKKVSIEVEKNEAPEEENLASMTEEEEVKVTIEDLPGVGPATAEKLREAGFEELLGLAVMSPADLAEEAELGEAVSAKIIAAAKKMANIGGFVSGDALLEPAVKCRSCPPGFNPSTTSSAAALRPKPWLRSTVSSAVEKRRLATNWP